MPKNDAWRTYKRDHPDYVRRQKALEKARHEARMRLSIMYQADYKKIYERIKKERGL